MKCLKCGTAHDGSLGSGKYCSRACANSRTRTDETKKKISEGVKRTDARRAPLSGESLERWKQSRKLTYEQRYQAKTFEELGISQIRRRVIEEQKKCCADCGVSEWKTIPITLELDHKDGNRLNNNRDNLWALCPNCHSTTETWRGRNKRRGGRGHQLVTDEMLQTVLSEHSTVRQALLAVGLAPMGGNYKRAKKLK
jgi:5-methylcytosine-specific restriction endonuclease McrA